MFGILLWKEIREHLMTFRFAAALVTIFLLVIISVWVNGNDYLRRRDTFNTLSDTAATQVAETYVVSQLVPIIHRPPSALSVFAQGEEKRLGNRVEIERYSIPAEASDSLTDNPLMASQQSFDLLLIFTFIISLFGILFTYDSISGERERGALRMLCSNAMGRRTIYLVKFVAGLIVLSIPVIISFLCALQVLQWVHTIQYNPDQWIAIGVMLFGGLLYGALFVAVGLCCSSLVRRPSTSLVLSLLIWTLLVVLIPGAATNTAKSLDPLPSPTEFSNFEQRTREETKNKVQVFRMMSLPRGLGGRRCTSGGISQSYYLLDSFNVTRWNDWIKYALFKESVWQPRAYTVWDFYLRFLEEKKRQKNFAEILSFPSPSQRLHNIFTLLAKTDYEAYADFMSQARRYRETFMQGLKDRGLFDSNIIGLISRRTQDDISSDEKIAERFRKMDARMQNGEDWEVVLGFDQFGPLPPELIPHFAYDFEKPDFGESFLPIGVLFFMLALVFFAGFIAFMRYDVR